jgi:rare lipoprotein A
VIDLSTKAAHLLDFYGDGVARVRVEYVGPAPLQGSDDSVLLATLRVGQPAPAPSPILLASSRPFFLGGGSSRASARGDVPIPPERPYTLGDNQGSPAAEPPAANVASVRVRSRPNVPPAFDDRFAANRVSPMVSVDPRHPSPIAAYAPPQAAPQGSPSIMTGRGLY